jgi:hypothetical protein
MANAHAHVVDEDPSTLTREQLDQIVGGLQRPWLVPQRRPAETRLVVDDEIDNIQAIADGPAVVTP